MVYYGLALNVGSIVDGNLQLNYLAMGVLELLAYVFVTLTLERFGRRKLYSILIFSAAFACLATMIPILAESGKSFNINFVNIKISYKEFYMAYIVNHCSVNLFVNEKLNFHKWRLAFTNKSVKLLVYSYSLHNKHNLT